MDKVPLTNDQLAAQFFDVMSRTSANVHRLYDMRKLIADCPLSIADVFERDGSLQTIKMRRGGFNSDYYSLLELILRQGVEAASKIVIERDIASMTYAQWKNMPVSGSAKGAPGILGDESSRRDVQVRFKDRE